MKKLLLVLSVFFTFSSNAENIDLSKFPELTGDKKTACEVILCMSSSQQPSECHPPIAKYFAIKVYSHGSFSPSKTIKKRREFLELCPKEDSKTDHAKMNALVDAISKQEVACVAEELNKIVDKKIVTCGRDCDSEVYYRTTTKLPAYCDVLFNHEYTDIKKPKYICDSQFYISSAWNKGYTSHYDYRDREIKTPIKKDCWVK